MKESDLSVEIYRFGKATAHVDALIWGKVRFYEALNTRLPILDERKLRV